MWNAREGAVYWTDIIGNTIWKWNPGVGRSAVLLEQDPKCYLRQEARAITELSLRVPPDAELRSRPC